MRALAAACLSVPFLAACGSREFRVSQAPPAPFNTYGRVDVRPFAIEQPPTMDVVQKDKALKMAEYLTVEVRDRLQGYFTGDGRTVVVQGKLVGFDPGSAAARYWAGFGAGKGTIVAEIIFLNEAGAEVGKGAAWGTVTGGFFGGSLNSAAKRVAKAVVDFVYDNFESVTSVATPSR